MEIFEQRMGIHKNGAGGRWRRATIGVPAPNSNRLGMYDQQLIVMLFKPDEEIDLKKIEVAFKKCQKLRAMNKDLEELKNSIMDGEGR